MGCRQLRTHLKVTPVGVESVQCSQKVQGSVTLQVTGRLRCLGCGPTLVPLLLSRGLQGRPQTRSVFCCRERAARPCSEASRRVPLPSSTRVGRTCSGSSGRPDPRLAGDPGPDTEAVWGKQPRPPRSLPNSVPQHGRGGAACRGGRERTGRACELGPPSLAAGSARLCPPSTPTPPAGLVLPNPGPWGLPHWLPHPSDSRCILRSPHFLPSSRFTQHLLSLFCFCAVSQPQHEFLKSQDPVLSTYAWHSKAINKYASNKRAVMTQ